MKLALLFSGGKDSTYAGYLAQQQDHTIECLITIISKNPDSYMFHTPNISKVKEQAKVMSLPLITCETTGVKELELIDLKKAIKKAINKYKIEGVITGAIQSVYQSSRIQRICDELKIKCLNPIWGKDEIVLLKELIKNKFKVIVIGVAAYPLEKSWLGRKIDKYFIKEVKELQKKYKINPAGEGGEFETFVLDCPMFLRKLKVIESKVIENQGAWKLEISVE
ncbi:MAG: diphthine--ammonia ligase [Nanoarchaeota archaeon]|nr:diphthine--ammonia ligase [Nanoarchaeota archaeon]